jgi:hypothetical protein
MTKSEVPFLRYDNYISFTLDSWEDPDKLQQVI